MLHTLIAACCLIMGHVHAPSGAPIAQAQIVIDGPKHAIATTDAKGDFSVDGPPGKYVVSASARGYAAVSVSTAIDADSHLDVVLEPGDSPKLRTIGQVNVNGGYSLNRNVIPEMDVTRQQMDAVGYESALDGLKQVPSAIIQYPDSGAPTAPVVVSLRGPDPSEALVTLDGQTLNDGNTGDLDISEFPVAAFNSINVTEGLGPTDSLGSNTFGGAVNFVTLQPTQTEHFTLAGSLGSYGTSQIFLNATGSIGKLGYAFAGSNFQQAGQVDANVFVTPSNYAPINCGPVTKNNPENCPTLTHLGSTISSRLGSVNLVYNFSQRADAGVRIFTLGNSRDESSAVNGIAGDPFIPCDPTDTSVRCPASGNTSMPNPEYGQNVGLGESTFSQSIRAYDVYSRSVLGAGSLLADFYASDNNVDLVGGGAASPYDVSHLDKRYNESLSWGRTFDTSEFAFGGYARQESLTGLGITQTLSQSIDSYYLRGAQQFGRNLRLSAGVYDADYSTFGNSVDWRLGASYDIDSSTVVRASAGTGFRAPLLIERYYFPEVIGPHGQVQPNPGLPPEDSNCVVAGQGNPLEKAEHATEYELGFSHLFSSQSNLDVSVYRSNLRDTIENFYPGFSCNAPNGFAYEIPINIGNAVYEGAEVRFKQGFPKQNLSMVLSYGLNVAFPFSLGPNVSNPTSGGTLVDYEQFLGVPQQQGSALLMWAQRGWHAATALTFAGNNNSLSHGPYTQTDAAVGKSFGRIDFTVAATNIFNSVSGPYTLYGGGVPYQGLYATKNGGTYTSNYVTDQLNILPASVRFILTVHE